MNVYFITLYVGYVGGYAVVVADTEDKALKMVYRKCKSEYWLGVREPTFGKFKEDVVEDIVKVDVKSKGVQAFYDGEY